jgi:hypothetical protein
MTTRAVSAARGRSRRKWCAKKEDGLDSKWQHAGKKGGKSSAMIRVDDGSGNGTMVRPCHKKASCVTCKVALRQNGSDKCNSCALAVMAAFFGT